MQWSILILTIPQRAALLARLLGVLQPQIIAGVELCLRQSDPALPVGENREIMRRQARGQYISFIDDDDLVPPHYVERILPLLDGVDYVGFNLEQRMDGRFACIEKRSLRFQRSAERGVWRDAAGQRFRDLSHLNPMRRELALRVPMNGWPSEDVRWADALRLLRVVKTEHYLDETLYYYLTRSDKPELRDVKFAVQPGSELYPWRLMPKIKVKMLTGIAGLPNLTYDLPEHSYAPGEVVEVHPKLAEAWIEGGICEAVAVAEKTAPEKPAKGPAVTPPPPPDAAAAVPQEKPGETAPGKAEAPPAPPVAADAAPKGRKSGANSAKS